MSFILIVLVLNLTWRTDNPWWGLVENPTKKLGIGTTWEGIRSEAGTNTGKIDSFYRLKKRVPVSFKELDESSYPGIEKTGNSAGNKEAILNHKGYDTDHYVVKYKDGSSCEFLMCHDKYIQKCTRKNYWFKGELVEDSPYIANLIRQ